LRRNPSLLFKLIQRTPFSREEFDRSFAVNDGDDCLENARRFFVSSWQGFGGSCHKTTGWKIQREPWTNSRANQLNEWHAARRNVPALARRLRSVQIEHADALEVIQRFDTAGTLFYLDPPYPAQTRNASWCKGAYRFEFGPMDHVNLANLAQSVKGMVLISSYPNDLYDHLYAGWKKVQTSSQTMNKTVALECLWISPNAQ
jgi:DNA adenine methylase